MEAANQVCGCIVPLMPNGHKCFRILEINTQLLIILESRIFLQNEYSETIYKVFQGTGKRTSYLGFAVDWCANLSILKEPSRPKQAVNCLLMTYPEILWRCCSPS